MTAKRSAWDAEVHHAAVTPPLAALTLYAAGAALSYLHHPLAVIGGAMLAAMAGILAVTLTHPHLWVLLHTSSATAAAAFWLAYTQLASPFTAPAATALAIALAVLWPLYPIAHTAERHEREDALERARKLLGKSARGGDWPGMLAALGLPRMQVEETIETRAGYTKVLRLPPDGSITFRRVRGVVEQLEVALDAEHGWVRVERGQRSRVLVHVVTRDVLAETIPLPPSPGPRSINDPIDLGLSETGEPLEITLREVLALIVGLRGSGKSNLLNALIERLANCVDVVIWMIDLKGGRTARPWLQPWLDGKTDRPVIDWVATDREEAAVMLYAALTGIDVRSHSGAGGEKITPSAHQPAIIVICEEVSALTGLHAPGGSKSVNLLTSMAQTGRSEAVDAILISQRGTVTMIGSGDLKSQAKLRIGLGVASDADARLLFDDAQMASGVAALVHPGSMYVQQDQARPIPAKGYRVEHRDIYGLAEACSDIRPGLERDLEDALGDAYAERWSLERAGHLLVGAARKPHGSTAASMNAPGAPATAAPSVSLPGIPPPPRDATPAWKTKDGTPLPRSSEHYTDPDVDSVFTALTRDLDVDATRPHAGRSRMLGLLEQAGASGLGPSDLTRLLNENGIGCVRQTVHGWLADEVAAGTVVLKKAGTYVHRTFA